MTYLSLTKQLADLGSDSPQNEAAELIMALTGRKREWCMLHKGEELPQILDEALEKRKMGIPLQYITCEAWFYGNRFIVTPDCLIPQPDTEHLVALALDNAFQNPIVLDLCTGSGCIAISILKENVTTKAFAVDISQPALDIAQKNAALNGVSNRISFVKADVLHDDLNELICTADIIVSNPPYINTAVIPTLSAEVRHEPHIALDGGEDGMIFYRHFLDVLVTHMHQDAIMLLEIGHDQSERIAEICQNRNLCCRFHKDFGGNIRVAQITHVNSDTCE